MTTTITHLPGGAASAALGSTADTVQALAAELHQFVSNLQKPRPNDSDWARSVRERCLELSQRIASTRMYLEATSGSGEVVSRALAAIRRQLNEYASELNGKPNLSRLRTLYQALTRAYEDFVLHLKGTEKSHLKPINYARNAFHISMGMTAVILYEFFITHAQAMAILIVLVAVIGFLEVSRRFSKRWNDFLVDRVFAPIARPRERNHVNSATYYLIAITLTAWLFPKAAAQLGLLVLALGDPAATLVGRHWKGSWGKTKLWKEKSRAGTIGCLVVSFAACYVFLTYMYEATLGLGPAFPLGTRLATSASVALAGAAAELFCEKLDDNFAMPLLCAAIATLWLS